jgi:hypothetical protein
MEQSLSIYVNSVTTWQLAAALVVHISQVLGTDTSLKKCDSSNCKISWNSSSASYTKYDDWFTHLYIIFHVSILLTSQQAYPNKFLLHFKVRYEHYLMRVRQGKSVRSTLLKLLIDVSKRNREE